MAGTVTVTEERLATVKKISWAWTSDASGDADQVTSFPYTGVLERLVTDPGSTAPTADYDVVVNDEDGVDVLMGAGADRHTSTTEQVLASSLGCVVGDVLNLVVSNAGDTKEGTVHLYIR